MWWKISAIVLSGCLIAGCSNDDSSSSAPPTPPPDNSAVHPTTQQLLTGPRSALELKFVPATLQAPVGWEVKSFNEGLVATVQGPTPTDFVSISLPASRVISTDQEKGLELKAKQDLDLHPELLPKLGVREITGGKVIEHLLVDPIQPTTQAAAATEPIQTMQWTFTICIPTADGKGFTAYDLRFLGMTLNQYKTDQAFLRSIIDSLTYTPSSDSLAK
jgi:hypothetical protein